MPDNSYLQIIFKVAVLVEIEETDIPMLLEKYREEGAAKIESVKVVTLGNESNYFKVLENALNA